MRNGRDGDAWPIALMLVAVVVPAACLLWFMSAAMRNERFAARQILADAWRVQLSASRARVEDHWQRMAIQLEELARATPPSVAFARCLGSGLVDSVVVLDEQGGLIYPDQPVAPAAPAMDMEMKWAQASQLEQRRQDFGAAAKLYGALATEATNINQKARALQAEARCFVQSGAKDAAIRLVHELLGAEQYARAVDPQGRLIAANAELMALELIGDETSPVFKTIGLRLRQRLGDYENDTLAAPQRRFLMKQFQKISTVEFPTLAAEELAAAFSERPRTRDTSLNRGPLPDTWQFTTPNGRVVALVHQDKLIRQLTAIAGDARNDALITVVPPGKERVAPFVSIDLGIPLAGWSLALSPKDSTSLDAMVKHRTAIYLWLGVFLVAVMGVLTLLAVRLLRRQTALARLKNDLAATVSHELKTPLASMRVLVDTLLDSERLDEQTAREYLQLIAQQNQRLSRLIHSFLTFSRIERKEHAFDFAPCAAGEIVAGATQAVHDRFQAPGCRFEAHVDPDLPPVMADREAIVAALINLLDNAWKYSGDIKHVVLRGRTENGKVLFLVQDNGIGIAPRERAKIFRAFYQVDRRLARSEGGCGLGLSIVQSIVSAHKGSVSVESEPGRGSTFTISIPLAATTAGLQEAIA
jgi:signal transduction histidine kinase